MHASHYEKEFVVETYFSDFRNEMTFSGMLKCAESIATEHVGRIGFSEAVLKKAHCAFMLSKVVIDIFRPLKTYERVRLATTAYAPDKIYYPRETAFYSQDNTRVALMGTYWLLIDTEKRRILRTSDCIAGFPFNGGKVEYDFTIPAGESFQSAGNVLAGYSMIDQNLHVNNAAYALIAMDAFSDALFRGARAKRLVISYNRQAEMGASIELARDALAGIVRGRVEGAPCFEAAVEFR